MAGDSIKKFLMGQVRMAQAETELKAKHFKLNHGTLCGLATMQGENDLSIRLKQVLGDSFEEFKGIAGAILRASKRTGESALSCISALAEADPARYKTYLRLSALINQSGSFSQTKEGTLKIRRTIEWDNRHNTTTTNHQQTKGSGDEFQDRVD